MIHVDLDELRRFTHAAMLAMGVSADEASATAEALMYSELRFHPGQGQGVARLVNYRRRIAEGLLRPGAEFEVLKESPALALVDAHNGLGSLVGRRAMRLAVAKAKVCGVGCVVVRNGTHYGSSAVHAAEAEQSDCLGIAFTNAGPEMAAWGGATPVVGTNPWSIAAPGGNGFPVVLDIALTTAGKGMMRWHEQEGRPMPIDWALTPDGEETTDPTAAMAGALLGIGQYKGYGLSLMTDVMTGVLSGGGFGTDPYSSPTHTDASHTFLAFDVAWFLPLEDFRGRMRRFADMVRRSKLRPGFTEVLLPGELEHRRSEEKHTQGVPLAESVFQELQVLAQTLGVRPLNRKTEALEGRVL